MWIKLYGYAAFLASENTITGNNRMLFRTGQTGELIVSDIPINR